MVYQVDAQSKNFLIPEKGHMLAASYNVSWPTSGSRISHLLTKVGIQLSRIAPVAIFILCTGLKSFAMFEESLLYYPSHSREKSDLKEWVVDEKIIGFCKTVESPKTVWLVFHGNAGQASNRGYIADCLPKSDSVYVMEYPGYGNRKGTPSMQSINLAASQAYEILRRTYPRHQIGVLGESLGSGPASYIGSLPDPPGRIVLVVPFDDLLSVAKDHFRFLPVSLLMRDKWDNVSALAKYPGKIDIFGAAYDTVIPVHHARNLADRLPTARYSELKCGHNDWSSRNLLNNEN
jgi:uncharacterized protein